MILVDRQIRKLCEQGMISPFDPALLNSHSIDVRIGDMAKVEDGEDLTNVYLNWYDRENPYKVRPNQFFLSCTLELVDIPPNIAAEFRLKSTRAREGWVHALAVWIDGGFNGSITLELGNARQHRSLPIYPGMKIGQLIFHETETPEVSYADVGRYNGYTTVQEAKPDEPSPEPSLRDVVEQEINRGYLVHLKREQGV